MSQKGTEQKIREILESKEEIDKLHDILPLWRESYKQAMESSEKSFTQMIFFFLIDKAALTKVSFFGLELTDWSIPYALVYGLCFMTFYRFVTLGSFAQMTEEAIREGNNQIYEKFSTENLMEFTVYPSLPQIENTLSNIEDDRGGFFTRRVFLFCPIFKIIPITCRKLWTNASG